MKRSILLSASILLVVFLVSCNLFGPETFKVTFESHGGSAVNEQEIIEGFLLVEPKDPVKTHYVFAGWFIDSEYSLQWNFSSDKVDQELTLHAKWDFDGYTVSFDSHGGSAVPFENVEYGQMASKPADPTMVGYDFAGWFTDATYATAWDFTSDTVDGNLVLHAKWTVSGYSGARLTRYIPVSTTDFTPWGQDYESPETLLDEPDGLESIFVGAGVKSVELFMDTFQAIMMASNPVITPRSLEVDLGIFLKDEGFNITDPDTSQSLDLFVNHFDFVANGSTTNFVKTILHSFNMQQVPDYLIGSRIGVSGDIEWAFGDVNFKMALFADASIDQMTLNDSDGPVDVKFALSLGTDRYIDSEGLTHNFPFVTRIEISPVIGVQSSDINAAISEMISQYPTPNVWANFCEAIWGTGTDHLRVDILFGDAQGNVDDQLSQSFAGYEVIQLILDIMNCVD